MPCDSTLEDVIDAQSLSNHLEINQHKMNLEPLWREWWLHYRNHIGWEAQLQGVLGPINGLVPANAKARLRMLTLYAVAAQANGLVVGTTNKTEAMLGYATKYGDGGVDIEPLMDFYKTEIFEIASELDIPQKIIDRKPSAGLWYGQTDEGEIGLDYETIDRHLQGEFLSVYVNDKINPLVEANKHKDLGLPCYRRQ